MSSPVSCDKCEFYTADEVAVFINGDTLILCQKCMVSGEQFIVDTYSIAD
jgi:hypothetical protein